MVNLTRINNNQITDAVSGNTDYGINANTKVQPYSVTSTLLANNLIYGSDLTITGNLSVTGNVTAIDTTNTTIEDPLLLLASTQSGAPSVDIGYIGQRGIENNVALIWNEANTTFATVYTNSGAGDNTTVNILGYADIKVANANITGTLNAANLSFTGNVTGNLDVTGYVNAGNVATTGTVSAAGNVTGNYFIGNGSQLTGITTDAIYNGNSSANISTPNGNLTVSIGSTPTLVATFYDNGLELTNSLSAAGNIAGANLEITNNLNAGGNISISGNIASHDISSTGNISTGGNIVSLKSITGAVLSSYGNIYGGNVITPGTHINGGVSSTGNITTNNTFIGNTLSGVALNITSSASGINLSAVGNINVNSTHINNLLDPEQAQDAATKNYVDNVASGLDLKQSCLVGTTVKFDSIPNVTNVVYYNGPLNDGVGATLSVTTSTQLYIDGVNVYSLGTGANARVLVKNESLVPTATSDAAWNGIYTITSSALGGGTTVFTRAVDFDNEGALGSMPGAFTFLQQGSIQTASGWVCISSNPITVGTTPITWAQFSGAQNYTAGNAIAINGAVIDALYDGTTIGINGSNQLYIPANVPLTTPDIGIATGTSLSVTGNLQGNNVFALNNLSASGNVYAGTDISAVGNVNVTDVNALGNVSAQGNVTADVLQGTTASVTGNIYSTYASVNGNIDGDYFNAVGGYYLNGSPFTGIASGSNNQIQFNEGNNFAADANLTFDPTSGVFATSNVSVSGNIIVSNTLLPDTDQGADIGTGSQAFNNIYTYGISGENAVGAVLQVNPNLQAGDFAVNGTTANILYVSGSSQSVSIGSNVQTNGASLAINSTDSILVPVGNVAQRPLTGVTGMFRWNTTYNYLEVYDGSSWVPVGFEQFTVIQNEQFLGDGSTTQFTLGSSQTTDSCIVTINGVLQTPTTAYSVSGVFPTCVLTFTEAPLVDDTIEVRELTTTTTVTGISNANATAVVAADPLAANVNITGNLVVAPGGYLYGNGAYLTGISGGGSNVDLTNVTTNIIPSSNAILTLGNATNQWAELYVSNASIIMGGVPLTSNGNILSFAGNVLLTEGTNGNISAAGNIIGTNVYSSGVISATGNVRGANINTAGLISATGNVYGDHFIGNGATLSSITGANVTGTVDNATNAVNATVATVVSGSAQGNITSVGVLVQLSSTGNITGANLRTTGIVTATGNVYGNFFVGNGSQLTGVTADLVAAGALTGNTLSANVTTSTLTSVGTLISLTVNGNVTSNNINTNDITGTSLSVSGDVTAANFIGNGSQLTNINTNNISNGASNVQIATSNGNVSVGVNGTDNVVVIADHGISTTGNILTPSLFLETNKIGSTGNLVIDPFNDGAVNGNVIIQGNLNVLGTTTTINSNVISINSLVYIAANNAPTASAANGAGLQIGNADYASLTFNSVDNEWNASIGLSVNGNINGGNLNLTGYIASTNGLQATDAYIGSYIDGIVVDYVTGNARISTGSLDGIQFYNEGIGNVLLAEITPTGAFSAVGNITGNNVSAFGNISGANINGNLHGVVVTPTQTSITSVGTLLSLSVSGAITSGNITGSNLFTPGIIQGNTTISLTGNSVAIGTNVGNTTANNLSVAIGVDAGPNQGLSSIAIGDHAAQNSQGAYSIALGTYSGWTSQGANSVAIGESAGYNNQGTNSVAIGANSGQDGQFPNAVAIGTSAGTNQQNSNTVAIGQSAGSSFQGYGAVAIGAATAISSQGSYSVAIGFTAGNVTQGQQSVAIGHTAGNNTQGSYAVALGDSAGWDIQGNLAIAIGQAAGYSIQSASAIAIGSSAGYSNQSTYSVAVGQSAGQTNQGTSAVAIGYSAGQSAQGNVAVAIGSNAGTYNQNINSVAIGVSAGATTQGIASIAVGNSAGSLLQGASAVAIGNSAGVTSQGIASIAVGRQAGQLNQGGTAVAIGASAGYNGQGSRAIAIGQAAGLSSQGIATVAIGDSAGGALQGNLSVAIGNYAGYSGQQANSVAIGASAGYNNQGANSIAIGNFAGNNNQGQNSIILNATGSALNQSTTNTFTVAPIRNDVSNISQVLFYNTTSKEVTYGNTISLAGTITGSSLTVTSGTIINGGTSAVGNIGSSTVPFNTIFAQATSAQYADLAEKYLADAEYASGTVVVFGGSAEVTVSSEDADRRVAGVVSTNPSYIMNGGLEGENVVTVALTGRVPCRVRGKVRKGDLMVSAGYGAARAEQDPKVGTVIGKALENFDGEEGIIEVVVGRV